MEQSESDNLDPSSSSLISWSCALIFSPRILLFAIGQSQQIMTPLESFLALHFGLLLAFSALGLVVNVTPFFHTHCIIISHQILNQIFISLSTRFLLPLPQRLLRLLMPCLSPTRRDRQFTPLSCPSHLSHF
jgi:hypothetical protein